MSCFLLFAFLQSLMRSASVHSTRTWSVAYISYILLSVNLNTILRMTLAINCYENAIKMLLGIFLSH